MGPKGTPGSQYVPKVLNDTEEECEYFFENGLRKVRPYFYTFQSYAKSRWLGRSLIEVMRREFHDLSEPYYLEAIKTGRLTINNQIVPPDYVFRNGDLMQHRVHRHEPPVGTNLPRILDLGRARGGDGSPIELDGFIVEGLGIPDQLVMVDKPSSIPVHPSGRYHHNSVTRLLHSLHPELFPHKKGALTKVFPCNRLDRLTSGLLTMALNAERAKEFEGHFGGRRVGKIYVARVRGEFPEGIITCDAPLMVYEHKLSLNCVSPSGKPAVTVFERLSFNGFSSVVRCKPLTGRTHQIRVHLLYLGHPIANDPLYGNDFWDEERPQMVLEPFPDNPDLRNEEPLARRVAERMRQATGGNRLGGWNFEGTEEAGSAMPGASQTAISDEAESKEGSTIPRQESEEGFESFCQDCRDKRPDPAPDQLGIWLHAMQYEFPSTPRPDIPEGATWTIRSPLPVWAASHFADDQRIIELLQSLWRGGFLLAPD